MKMLAVINSSCLNRLIPRLRQELFKGLHESVRAEIVVTAHEKDIHEAVKKYPGFNNIISCGGDGTFFNIINTIDITGKRFGIVPLGTGNGLARDLGIKNFSDAIDKISRGRVRDIDLMDVRFSQNNLSMKRLSASTAAAGFFARVARNANLRYKKLGRICYPAATLLNSFDRHCYSCSVSFDGSGFEHTKFKGLLVNNTAHAGCVRVFKNADMRDNRLNAWFNKTGLIGQLLWDLGMITNTHFYFPGKHYVFKKMAVRINKPAAISLDGEIFDYAKEIEFCISKKKASFFC
jgi:diacylglycerol kinase (ATP)